MNAKKVCRVRMNEVAELIQSSYLVRDVCVCVCACFTFISVWWCMFVFVCVCL